MNPLLWLAGVLLFISAVCFVADWWISSFGEGASTSNGSTRSSRGVSPSPMSFSEALKPIGGAPSWASVRRND